ncbi:MAG: ribulose bisphosphate carboxylase small subunit [Cyanobacteria bacterium]|nr:ribulose bisphosphate carboxylase small subunit [Cyanobacteriota bacterium]MDW8200939.1 ribulose bisphosphate carboxylase small subunit [Cyanobacteriota bacterium SKYGB_h_bin112]
MQHYISPRFLDKVAVHITKNYLTLPGVRVPLILGIHGRKGEGKSYQCELVFERMGIEAVRMSAGELESPDAGDPSRLIRLRYREAAELIRVRGQMAVLMINDLDAGAGRLDRTTQYTVNTQLVHGTLMNIADNPTNVQLPGSYDETPLHRVPILVTGNDFSTLYAPLVRDGRMEKFYWEPDRNDRIGIVGGIFGGDLSSQEVAQLVDAFPNQAIDFFSALRARLYDEQIRQFIHQVGIEKVSKRLVNSVDRPPEFTPPDVSLPRLLAFGQQMVQEQDWIQNTRLMEEYLSRAVRDRGSSPSSTAAPKLGGRQRAYARDHQDVNSPIVKPGEATLPVGSLSSNGTTALDAETLKQLRQLLANGYRLGIEYVDQRRFRTNSWQNYATVTGGEQMAIATLEACLSEHPQDYVRLVAIEPKARRRLSEVIIQRPR